MRYIDGKCHSYPLIIDLVGISQNTFLSAEVWFTTVQGRATQRSFSGSSAHEDVVVGSARAYVNALNKIIAYTQAQKVPVPAEVHAAVAL